MCETTEILYCVNCKTRQAFLLSSSATKAVCPECGEEIEGLSKIRVMKEAEILDYKKEKETKRFRKAMDNLFDELNKI